MVWEVENNMPATEFKEWLIYFKIKNEEESKAYKKAKQEAESKARSRRR